MEELLEIDFDLVGKSLEQDIYSELNILLLKKGAVLTEANIVLLKKHNFKNVKVSENLSFEDLYRKNSKRIHQLFTDQDLLKQPFADWFQDDTKLFRLINEHPSTIEEIYSLNNIEKNLSTHSANVGIISVIIGKILGYSMKNLKLLWQMGMLHDIGKVKSDDDEDDLNHGKYGYRLLKDVSGIHLAILDAVRYHHERVDGSGFPKGLKGKEIPIMVQIVSVANVVDHLYKEMNNFQVMNQLIEESHLNKLNPAIVIPFVRFMYSQNIGKKIKLSDSRSGVIVFIHDNEPSQPLVHIEEENDYIDMRKHHFLKVESYG